MQEIQVQFRGGKDTLEKEMVTHSSILAWRIPWTGEPGRLQSTGSQKSEIPKGTFHVKMGTIKDRNGRELTKAEDIKKMKVKVKSLSHVRLFVNPWTASRQAFLSINNSQSLLKLMSIESVMPTNHLILC